MVHGDLSTIKELYVDLQKQTIRILNLKIFNGNVLNPHFN